MVVVVQRDKHGEVEKLFLGKSVQGLYLWENLSVFLAGQEIIEEVKVWSFLPLRAFLLDSDRRVFGIPCGVDR